MLLSEVFDERSIITRLESARKGEAFKELIEAVKEVHAEMDRDTMLDVIRERERKMHTAIANGVAIPHGYYPGTGVITGAVGLSRGGVDYETPDGKPVHCIFLVLMGETSREKHLNVLSRLSRLAASDSLKAVMRAATPRELFAVLSQWC